MEVKKELKYPIMYAIMPIEESIGWYLGVQEYGVVANVVSKCYVIEERKKYLRDGSFNITYEVVFPVVKKDSVYRDEFESQIPQYSLYSKCINSVLVNQLFNSYDEAKLAADKANSELLSRAVGITLYDEKFKDNLEKLKANHQEVLDRYKKIQEMIESETCEMEITGLYSSSSNYDELTSSQLSLRQSKKVLV